MIIVINVYDMLELDVYGKMKSQARSVCSVGGGEWWECEAGGQCKLHWEGGTEQRLGDLGVVQADVSPSEEPSKGKE